MVKKVSFLSRAGVFLMLSLLAPAQTAPATPDPHTLGLMDGLLNFCGKVNPASAPTFNQWKAQLTSGLTTASLAQLRSSPQYQEAFGKISERMGDMSTKAVVAACTPR